MLKLETIRRFIPFGDLQVTFLKEMLKYADIITVPKGSMFLKRNKKDQPRTYLVEGKVDLIDTDFNCHHLDTSKKLRATALNANPVNEFSAIAKSDDVKLLRIDRDHYDRIMSWKDSAISQMDHDFEVELQKAASCFEVEEVSRKHVDWMSSLIQSPLFTKVPMTKTQELFKRFETCETERDEIIVREGERGDYFYVIASGSARVFNRNDSVEVFLRAGDYFGEEALLGETVRNATIQMLEQGRIKRLNSKDFADLLEDPVLKYVNKRDLVKLGSKVRLLDVRMPMEFRAKHVPGSINVPLSRLRDSLAEFTSDNIYVLPDTAGNRADIGAHLICQAGFEAVILKTPINEPAPVAAS